MQHHVCDISAQDAKPESYHEETSDKPKEEDILQNSWPVIFKSVKVMRVKKD